MCVSHTAGVLARAIRDLAEEHSVPNTFYVYELAGQMPAKRGTQMMIGRALSRPSAVLVHALASMGLTIKYAPRSWDPLLQDWKPARVFVDPVE